MFEKSALLMICCDISTKSFENVPIAFENYAKVIKKNFKTNTSPIITSKTITNVVMVSIVYFNITCYYKCLQRESLLLLHLQDNHILV